MLGLGAENLLLERRGGLWHERGKPEPFTGINRVVLLDGTKRSETIFRAGRRHGLERVWYTNGRLKSSIPFANGMVDGNATYFYRSGTLQTYALFRAGKQHGHSIDFWPDGKKSFEENYADGVADGTWRSWWPSGKLSSVKIYSKRRLTSHLRGSAIAEGPAFDRHSRRRLTLPDRQNQHFFAVV